MNRKKLFLDSCVEVRNSPDEGTQLAHPHIRVYLDGKYFHVKSGECFGKYGTMIEQFGDEYETYTVAHHIIARNPQDWKQTLREAMADAFEWLWAYSSLGRVSQFQSINQ